MCQSYRSTKDLPQQLQSPNESRSKDKDIPETLAKQNKQSDAKHKCFDSKHWTLQGTESIVSSAFLAKQKQQQTTKQTKPKPTNILTNNQSTTKTTRVMVTLEFNDQGRMTQ